MLLCLMVSAAAQEPGWWDVEPLPTGVQLELAGGVVGAFGLVATGMGVLPLIFPDNDHPVGTSMVGAGGLLVSSAAPVLAWRARERTGRSPASWMGPAALGLYVAGLGTGLTGTGLGFADRPSGPWLQVAGVGMLSASTALLLIETEQVRFENEQPSISLQVSPWVTPGAQASWGLGLQGAF